MTKCATKWSWTPSTFYFCTDDNVCQKKKRSDPSTHVNTCVHVCSPSVSRGLPVSKPAGNSPLPLKKFWLLPWSTSLISLHKLWTLTFYPWLLQFGPLYLHLLPYFHTRHFYFSPKKWSSKLTFISVDINMFLQTAFKPVRNISTFFKPRILLLPWSTSLSTLTFCPHFFNLDHSTFTLIT